MKRSIAKYTAASLTCVGLLTAGAAAFAQGPQDPMTQSSASQTQSQQDEYLRPQPSQSNSTSTSTTTTTSKSSSSKHSAMKDCVARERAGDSTLSEKDAKKACHESMKAQKDNPDNQPQPQ
jgi:ubiquitin